jgi:alpha-1,3-rhamnosyl/mannosyltransferase
VRIGRVTDDDRDGLLKLSRALVFPSLYEGFGAPVIEAMQLGTPVIASDCAALPEIVGDAGLVLSLKVEIWADSLDAVASKKETLVKAGKLRAEFFSIVNSGKDLAQAYEAANS